MIGIWLPIRGTGKHKWRELVARMTFGKIRETVKDK